MTGKKLNDRRLEDFMNTHYGYGNYGGQYWFIGMEPGGGTSKKEIMARHDVWDRRRQEELVDLHEYHDELFGENNRWTGDKPKLQPTWKQLIRILLSAEGQSHTREDVLKYQKNRLGRKEEETCLMELLPLARRSAGKIGKWFYGKLSDLDVLKTPEAYKEYCDKELIGMRIKHIQRRIIEWKPRIVVLYGMKYRDKWSEIAGVEFNLQKEWDVKSSKNTVFAVTRHPVSHGVTNKYFHTVGRSIASQLR